MLSKDLKLCLNVLDFYDLSFASTETKYIKLKTKTQNNIVMLVFTKKSAVLVFGFLVFRPSNGFVINDIFILFQKNSDCAIFQSV